MSPLSNTVSRLNARHRLMLSIAITLLTWLGVWGRAQFFTHAIACWDAFGISSLVLAWIAMVATPQREIRERVRAQDVAGPWMSLFVILAAVAALLAVVLLLRANKAASQPYLVLHVVLTILAVLSSWSLVHTVFGLHYAHTFYGDGEDPRQHHGGIEFPGTPKPDYIDFAYFSFVIGMTFQVSDVQITSRRLRQIVLMHSILAFAFNTIILALAINTLSSLF